MKKKLPKPQKVNLTPEQLQRLREAVAIEEEFPNFMIGSRSKVWPSDFPKEWHPRADDADPLPIQDTKPLLRKAKKTARPQKV